jgi:cation transport ATPase
VLAALTAVATLAGTGWGRARAELLEVRQIAGGMECAECARGLRLLVKQIAGVDDAETSWNRRVLTVRFHPGNRATLAQVRAAVARQHFEAREAEIVVAGLLTLDAAGGAWLRVAESTLSYRIELTGRDAAWRRALTELAGAQVVVTGRVPGSARAEDPLLLFPVDLRRALGRVASPAH